MNGYCVEHKEQLDMASLSFYAALSCQACAQLLVCRLLENLLNKAQRVTGSVCRLNTRTEAYLDLSLIIIPRDTLYLREGAWQKKQRGEKAPFFCILDPWYEAHDLDCLLHNKLCYLLSGGAAHTSHHVSVVWRCTGKRTSCIMKRPSKRHVVATGDKPQPNSKHAFL